MKTFPIQVQPKECRKGSTEIPMDIAIEAYKEYATRYGTRQSLERLGERGGFGIYELAELLCARIKRLEGEE